MELFFGILGGLLLFGLMSLVRKFAGLPNMHSIPAVAKPPKFTAVSADGYAEVLTQFVAGKSSSRLQVSHLHDLSEGLFLTRAGGEITLSVSFLPLKEAPRLDKFVGKIGSLGLDPAKETRAHVGEGSKVETLTLEWKAIRDPLALRAQTNEILTLLQGPPGASIYILAS